MDKFHCAVFFSISPLVVFDLTSDRRKPESEFGDEASFWGRFSVLMDAVKGN